MSLRPVDPHPWFGHVPALDGLRGVAVAGVLLFHAGHLRGGFLGVDLFFVLSGFLITSLLLAEWDSSGRVDLRRFWSRRFRRLLPAALILLIAAAVLAGTTMSSADLHRFRGDALAALADVANWHAIGAGSDYWASSAAPSPLQHMWSLSIEEQLYLAWPLLVVGALSLGRRRRAGRQPLVLVGLAGVALSAGAMFWWSTHGEDLRAYYGTDARASAVLLGGLMALLVSGQRRGAGLGLARALRPAVPVAAAALAAAWLWAEGTSHWLYRGGFPMLSLAAAVVVGSVAVAGPGRAMGCLEWSPLRWLGRVSYGVYLWHWPIYTVLDEDVVSARWARTLLRIAVTLAVAALSYRLVEQPIRRGDLRTAAWRIAAPAGAVAVVAATLIATHGAQGPPRSGTLLAGKGSAGKPSALVLGDSEAFVLGGGQVEVADPDLTVSTMSIFGCGIGPGLVVTDHLVVQDDGQGIHCRDAVDEFARSIARAEPDVVIVNVGAWELFDRLIDGTRVPFGTARWDQETEGQLARVLERFGEGGRPVAVLTAPCYTPRPIDDGRAAILTPQQADEVDAVRRDDARVHHWNDLLVRAAGTSGAHVLRLDELFCGAAAASAPSRPDGVHLDQAGATAVWRWLLPQVLELS